MIVAYESHRCCSPDLFYRIAPPEHPPMAISMPLRMRLLIINPESIIVQPCDGNG